MGRDKNIARANSHWRQDDSSIFHRTPRPSRLFPVRVTARQEKPRTPHAREGTPVAAAAGLFQKQPQFARGATRFSESSRRAEFSPHRGQHGMRLVRRARQRPGGGPPTGAGFPKPSVTPGTAARQFFEARREFPQTDPSRPLSGH
jgi:hypothetical protein